MFTRDDARWAHGMGVSLDAPAAREDVDPHPMVSGESWSAQRDATDYATLRAIDAERSVEKLESRVNFWRTIAIVALAYLLGAAWIIGTTRAVNL